MLVDGVRPVKSAYWCVGGGGFFAVLETLERSKCVRKAVSSKGAAISQGARCETWPIQEKGSGVPM